MDARRRLGRGRLRRVPGLAQRAVDQRAHDDADIVGPAPLVAQRNQSLGRRLGEQLLNDAGQFIVRHDAVQAIGAQHQAVAAAQRDRAPEVDLHVDIEPDTARDDVAPAADPGLVGCHYSSANLRLDPRMIRGQPRRAPAADQIGAAVAHVCPPQNAAVDQGCHQRGGRAVTGSLWRVVPDGAVRGAECSSQRLRGRVAIDAGQDVGREGGDGGLTGPFTPHVAADAVRDREHVPARFGDLALPQWTGLERVLVLGPHSASVGAGAVHGPKI